MTRRPLHLAAALGCAALLAACGDGLGSSAPSVTMPTSATHARFFPIAPGDAHGPAVGQAVADCNACHYDKITRAPSVAFTTFTCTGCHVPAPTLMHDDLAALTTLHRASPAVTEITARTGQAYDTLDAACRACHPQGIRDAIDHALHFPLPHGDAAGATVARCGECHVKRTAGQYLVMGCATCHPHDLAATATAHVGVTGFVPLVAGATPAQQEAASALCVRCHGSSTVPVTVAGHAALAKGFAVGGSAVHTGAGAACLTCHPALSTAPGKKLAADFKVTSCVGCHDLVGPSDVDHGSRAALQAYHLALVDKVTGQPVPKAVLFPSVVDAAVAAAGGDADRGLSAACLACHPQGLGAHPYYLLPHQNLAKTVVASCEQCHVTALRKSDLGCAACHAATSPVGPKHARVPDVAPADTSLAASALCARCHEYDAIPTRVATGHTPFPIDAGAHSGAAGGACLKCHPSLKGEPTPWAGDFKKTSCTGCHVAVSGGKAQHDDQGLTAGQVSLATLHAGVTDYAVKVAAQGLSAACRTCHPKGVAGPPADHDQYFGLSATSKHVYPSARIAACLDCHTSSNRKNPADFRCAQCHAADAVPLATGHAAVPDLAADPLNPVKCLACHADGKLPATTAGVTVTVKSHATAAKGFVVGAGSHSGTKGGTCLTCHPTNRLATVAAPHWEYARDFKQVTCVGCHVAVGGGKAQHDDQGLTAGQVSLATLHAGVTTYATTVAARGLSAACLYCHADGAGGAPANHPQLFPIGAGTKHAGLGCSECHTSANRKDVTALACKTCHDTKTGFSTKHNPVLVGGRSTSILALCTPNGTDNPPCPSQPLTLAGCLKCHADSQLYRVSSHPGGDSGFGTGEHRSAGCLTCHSRLRTDKPWGTNFKEAKGSLTPTPTGCYTCHRSGSG
ncbi:MAG: hypothetical protein IPO09_19665 [Anaeromyxobacter sp.]|nr:hypothetical protein [Anaeromyxobacter sp.]MBL0274985.1 hypothetical protein [Anaeromyxobacter sp.]